MQMQPVFGDKRPVVVVVDEIDGLAPDAVDELISMIKATPDRVTGATAGADAADADGAASGAKGKKGKKSGSTFKDGSQCLTRPVICICNDMVRECGRIVDLDRRCRADFFAASPLSSAVWRFALSIIVTSMPPALGHCASTPKWWCSQRHQRSAWCHV